MNSEPSSELSTQDRVFKCCACLGLWAVLLSICARFCACLYAWLCACVCARLWVCEQLLLACREALMRAAGGPQLFLTMRAAFTASLAAVSIAGYVAGVGDRHTDNFLLDLSSGSLVPIDFG